MQGILVGQRRISVTPKFITIAGKGAAASEYRLAIAWWRHALQSGISAPLAPRLVFPHITEIGSVFQFTDAAREAGTGFGGFSVVRIQNVPTFLYIDPRWPEVSRQQLQENILSMPAGEGLGVVLMADALIEYLGDVSHLTIFSDSDPVVASINSANSGSPQLNFIVRWLLERHQKTQMIAVHQPGVRNGAADDLSRHSSAAVLETAGAAGLQIIQLPLPKGWIELVDRAAEYPQRAK